MIASMDGRRIGQVDTGMQTIQTQLQHSTIKKANPLLKGLVIWYFSSKVNTLKLPSIKGSGGPVQESNEIINTLHAIIQKLSQSL